MKFFTTLLLATMATPSVWAQQDSLAMPVQPDTIVSTTMPQDSVPVKRERVDGFRVQIYYGGNNQKSKLQARRMAERAKIWFEEHKVYTSFASPHWMCRVGDFRTREEAMELLTTMRETGRFPRAVIVKCKVTVYVYESNDAERTDSCATGDSTACPQDTAVVG